MKLSDFKKGLGTLSVITFIQPNGKMVPAHFHITEVGLTTKNFIDCGGTIREEKVVNFQLWEASDFDHRLSSSKLSGIIALSEKMLGLGDYEVEVEYQTETIGRYEVSFNGSEFMLVSKKTDCLAKENCGVPLEKQKVNLSELQNNATSCCSPDSGCCN